MSTISPEKVKSLDELELRLYAQDKSDLIRALQGLKKDVPENLIEQIEIHTFENPVERWTDEELFEEYPQFKGKIDTSDFRYIAEIYIFTESTVYFSDSNEAHGYLSEYFSHAPRNPTIFLNRAKEA